MVDFSELVAFPPNDNDNENGHRHRRRAEHIVNHALTTATARYSMILVAFLVVSVIIPGGSYALIRLINTQDRTAEREEKMERDFAALQTQVVNIVSDQVKNSKNIAERIDSGEKMLNDRINAQASWAQQISAKIDELSKFVYQKVR